MLSFGGNDDGVIRPSPYFSPPAPPSSPPEEEHRIPSPFHLERNDGEVGFFYEYEKRVVHGALTKDKETLLADIRRRHYELQVREQRIRDSCHNTDVTASCMTMTYEQFNTCCRLNREMGGLLKTLESVDAMLRQYDTSFYSIPTPNMERPEPHDVHSSYGARTASVYNPPFAKPSQSWP